MERTRRRGMTLLEVLVALALSGIVVLGAHELLRAVADGAARVIDGADVADRDANAERLLRGLVGRIEVGTSGALQFGGDEREARFSSWCDVPEGWQERCQVVLAVARRRDASALTATLSTGERIVETIVLREGFSRGALRYLSDPRSGGTWIRDWGVGITTPVALGVIIDRDTLLVRIGSRG